MTSRDHTKTPVHHASRITHHASLLLLAFQLVSLSASPATITFHLQKFTQAAATNRATLITPLSITPPAGQLALYDRALYLSDTNGAFTVTNMLPGAYRCVVQSPPDRTEFWITVPATNATLYAADLLVVPTNSTAGPDSLAYSITASDARYAPLGSISTGTISLTNLPDAVVTNGSGPSFGTTHVGQLGVAGGSYGGALVVIDENGEAYGRAGDTVWALGITGMSYFMRGIVVGADPGPPNTNVFIIDGDGVASGNGRGLTNVPSFATTGRAVYATNANNGRAIDSTLPYQLFTTNATFTTSGFSGLTNGMQHVLSMTVSNSSASAITWNGPPTTFYFGASSSSALSIPSGKEAVISFWIWPNLRTNACNAIQQ